MKHCEKCGANSPARFKRCVHCHADFVVFIGVVVMYGVSLVWGFDHEL